MEYNKFKDLLQPAIEILVKQNDDFKQRFGKEIFTIQTVSEVELTKFEEKYKIKIPKFYREFLKEYNPSQLEIMFHGIFGLKEIGLASDYLRNEISISDQSYIPIASDNCGNYFGTINNSQTIFICDHE